MGMTVCLCIPGNTNKYRVLFTNIGVALVTTGSLLPLTMCIPGNTDKYRVLLTNIGVAFVTTGSLLPLAMNIAYASTTLKVVGNFAWGNHSPRCSSN